MVRNDDIIPGFHAVEFMRKAREELSREMEGRSPEEFRRWLRQELEKSELWRRLQEQKSP